MKVNTACLYFKGKPNKTHEFRKKKYKKKPIAFRENILFTDESKFEIWRSMNEDFKDKCVAKTVKDGGGSVMVRGCMAALVVGNFVL